MIFSMALDPGNLDLRAFVNREKQMYQLKGIIGALLQTEGIGLRKRYCICGERGVGKSMLMQKVISELKQEEPDTALYAVVDCSIDKSAKRALEKCCEKLAESIKEHFPHNKDMCAEAEYLAEIVFKNEIMWGTVKSRTGGVNASGGFGVFGFLEAKIGLGAQRGEQISEAAKVEVDLRFLRHLIQNTAQSLKDKHQLQVVFVLDNLDQLESPEEIEQLVQELFAIQEVVYILTVRNESISSDIRRNTTSFMLNGFEKEALVELATKRLETLHPETIPEFEKYAIHEVSEKLASLTDNPFSYLKWLNHLYLNLEMDDSIELLKEGFQGFLETEHGLFRFDEIQKLANLFFRYDNEFLTQAEIVKPLQLRTPVFNRLRTNRILIPNDVFEPTEYRLAPDLFFFKLFRDGEN